VPATPLRVALSNARWIILDRFSVPYGRLIGCTAYGARIIARLLFPEHDVHVTRHPTAKQLAASRCFPLLTPVQCIQAGKLLPEEWDRIRRQQEIEAPVTPRQPLAMTAGGTQ
jgi:hypothetical protein